MDSGYCALLDDYIENIKPSQCDAVVNRSRIDSIIERWLHGEDISDIAIENMDKKERKAL